MEKVLSYYERRAEAELQMAQDAVHPAAVYAHSRLADLYLERIYQAETRANMAGPGSRIAGRSREP